MGVRFALNSGTDRQKISADKWDCPPPSTRLFLTLNASNKKTKTFPSPLPHSHHPPNIMLQILTEKLESKQMKLKYSGLKIAKTPDVADAHTMNNFLQNM